MILESFVSMNLALTSLYGSLSIDGFYFISGDHTLAYAHIYEVQSILKKLCVHFTRLTFVAMHTLLYKKFQVYAVKHLLVVFDANIKKIFQDKFWK